MSHSGEPFDPYYQWLGIPPDEQPPHHYRLLGLQLFEENRAVIQHAADRQMSHLRTLQNGPRALLSQQLLNEVATAKLCLLSPEKKGAYDAQLASPPPMPPPAPPLDHAPPPPESPPPPASPQRPSLAVAPAVGYRAGSRRARPARHMAAWLWLVALLATAAPAALVWWHFRAEMGPSRLILEWPVAHRAGATVAIDGRTWAVDRGAIDMDSQTVTLALSAGRHRVEIARPGQPGIDQWVETRRGQETRLAVALAPPPVTGTLDLLWPHEQRDRATLELDSRPIDWRADATFQDDREVRLSLTPGEHSLRITRDGQVIIERSVSIAPGRRLAVQVLPGAGHLVLCWPTSQRDQGSLEIDRHQLDPSRLANPREPDVLRVVLPPGRHELRVRLGSGAGVEYAVDLAPGQEWRVDVEQRLAEQSVPPAPPAPQPPQPTPLDAAAAGDREQERKAFQARYHEFEEYQPWAAEQEAGRGGERLDALVDRLAREAGLLAAGSIAQEVAYDECIRLALAEDAFAIAHRAWKTATETGGFTAQESAAQADRIWAGAFASTRSEALLALLTLSRADGRVLTPSEQMRVVNRLADTPDLPQRYGPLLDQIHELETQEILSPEAAIAGQVRLLVKASAGSFTALEPALDLADRLLMTIPDVFESGVPGAPQHVAALLDALKQLRRKAIRDAGMTESLRSRVEAIDQGSREVREWQSQYARIRSARQTLAEQPAAPAEHRLVAFWLLQLGRFSAAGPHLRDSGDAALARLAGPLPASDAQRAALAEAIRGEADRGRYSRRQADALRAYADFVHGARPLTPPRSGR